MLIYCGCRWAPAVTPVANNQPQYLRTFLNIICEPDCCCPRGGNQVI